MLFSAELKKRPTTIELELRYIADSGLYTKEERDAIADEIKRLFVRLIENSVHCEIYNLDKRHSRETCDECKEAQKRSTRVIDEMPSIRVSHLFYQQVLPFTDIMDDYFTSDHSFSDAI
jgi:hypothetical protein